MVINRFDPEKYDDRRQLEDYILRHYRVLLSKHERFPKKEYLAKIVPSANDEQIEDILSDEHCDDEIIDKELLNARADFNHDLCYRIMSEYKDKIVLNRCPKCSRIVETPKARLCLWCGHDWH